MSVVYTLSTFLYPMPGREEVFREYSRGFGYVVGFLNTCGGVLHFGVRHDGRVVGVSCTRKEEDDYKLTVDNIIKLIQPKVPPSLYRLDFIPIVSSERKVISLHVSAGPELLYMDGSERSMVISSARLYGPLIPQEIQRLVLHKYKKDIINAETLIKVITPHHAHPRKTKKHAKGKRKTTASTTSKECQAESNTSTPQCVIVKGTTSNADVESTIITISDSDDVSKTATPVRNPSDLFASPGCSTVKIKKASDLKRGPDILSPIRFPDMSGDNVHVGKSKKLRNS